MRKHIILIVFINLSFCVQNLQAQTEWAPIGAKWYYSAPYTGKCLYMKSVNDTTIANKSCKILEIRFCKNDDLLSKEFLYQQNDSVFYYNYYQKEFYLLYNFRAKTGDTVNVHKEQVKLTDGFYGNGNHIVSTGIFKYQISNTDSINVSGVWLKRQEIRQVKETDWAHHREILIEKIGAKNYFFGRFKNIALENDYIGLLRCYEDSSFKYKSNSWDKQCNLNASENNSFIKKQPNIEIYPNPIKNNQVYITAPYFFQKISIIDITGHTVMSFSRINKKTIFLKNLSLSKGIYLIKIRINDKVINDKIIIL